METDVERHAAHPVAPGFELFDHTAEVGLRAWGPTPAAAFAAAAEGMFSVIVDPGTVRPTLWKDIAVEASDAPDLLVCWLNELLYLLDAELFVPVVFYIDAWSETSLTARAGGDTADRDRHAFRSAVKTVTYHRLSVAWRDDRWQVEAILDV